MIFLVTLNKKGSLLFCTSINSWGYFRKQADPTKIMHVAQLQPTCVVSSILTDVWIDRLTKFDHLYVKDGELPTLEQLFNDKDIIEWIDEEPRLRKRRPW